METNELVTLIGSLGFPIVMCLWFMYRTEKVMSKNTDMTEKNTDVLNKIADKLGCIPSK